ncbi:unnamed protein product [Orchesella dallaii]|uniref:XIAP-associated factor 1 n=1 Tax=Orchesella dallaii TaxID=48710 RepID=A0ABP1PST2_9HEXA
MSNTAKTYGSEPGECGQLIDLDQEEENCHPIVPHSIYEQALKKIREAERLREEYFDVIMCSKCGCMVARKNIQDHEESCMNDNGCEVKVENSEPLSENTGDTLDFYTCRVCGIAVVEFDLEEHRTKCAGEDAHKNVQTC